ncbi:MAG: hypothetical protein ONB17_00860 [candidate division KSB1 bacterium]|nr:hypothetical protein [candidate division KSB1 bacterium]MDZ7294018.1 hypothetical protein [candidate division KSB1 bacterium]MDZ7385821.1 hypothetical protein [candidate division KSB1 bacterium]MDZ7392714.1 hypothetical protein [candidate division KSB1 bacterium]MDZ7412076.1 hypothetical protein [candidate division KSB1 bacterium]
MVSKKRLVLCTVLGGVFGVVCWGMLSTKYPLLSTGLGLGVILSRTAMGWALGGSGLRIPWWLHALVMGLIFSLPLAVPFLDAPALGAGTAFAFVVMGIVYALLIEAIATFIFKVGPQAGP